MTQNRVSATLDGENRQAVMQAIETIRQHMPFLVHLTTDDRKTLPKTGNRGRGFILNALDAAEQHTDCLPRSFDVAEMRKDVQLMDDLYPVLMALSQLKSAVDDTYLTANCEAYAAALRVYDSAKAHEEMPGMPIVIERLRQQFIRRAKKEVSEGEGAGDAALARAE
jgi:hypothetical protein